MLLDTLRIDFGSDTLPVSACRPLRGRVFEDRMAGVVLRAEPRLHQGNHRVAAGNHHRKLHLHLNEHGERISNLNSLRHTENSEESLEC